MVCILNICFIESICSSFTIARGVIRIILVWCINSYYASCKEIVIMSLRVDSFKTYEVQKASGSTSCRAIVGPGQRGVSENASFTYLSQSLSTNATPDNNAALLNTITFTLSKYTNSTSRGGYASSNVSFWVYDGDPSDNDVITSGSGAGQQTINLFQYTLKNNFITIKATGNVSVEHGSDSSDGEEEGSASISNIMASYLTLAYDE